LRVGEALPDLRGERVLSELVLHAAQRVCLRILSGGQLVDHRRKCTRGIVLRRGDAADLIIGLL